MSAEQSASLISIEGFKKTFKTSAFKKPSVAATNINVRVHAGEVHGFLGPNGAGKSTTIKALLGLIAPDGGRIELFGEPVAHGKWRARVGYMPEHPTFYDYLTARELVTWFGRLLGMSRADARAQAATNLERVGLGQALDRRLRTYSKGMVQRAGLAQALMGSPDLLILDEPMTGLDPLGRRDMRELILELKNEGRTIFFSTHILPDIEMTCDRVTIVHRGETRRAGELDTILSETTRGVTVRLADLPSDAFEGLKDVQVERQGSEATVEWQDLEGARAHTETMIRRGARLLRFEPHKDSLEAIFVRSLGD